MPQHERPESPRTHPRESSFLSLMSGWAQQGVQSYFATQRILVDLAMRQNSSVVHALKERLSDPHHSPSVVLAELASDGITNLVEAQKVLLELGRQQHEIVMTGVKERTRGSSTATAMANLLRHSVDTVIEMQQEFLKIAGTQTRTWIEGVKTGKAPKGSALVDVARQAVENFIHAEKRFLDGIAEEATRVTKNKPVDRAEKKTKKTELAELGRRATESFIEAQKRLVDVAGRQMNANLKTASRAMEILKPLPVVPLSDWTRAGVQSFVEAQKALMDAVTKSGNGTKPAAGARRKTVRGAKRRRPSLEKPSSHPAA
jgi:hypothetical protein